MTASNSNQKNREPTMPAPDSFTMNDENSQNRSTKAVSSNLNIAESNEKSNHDHFEKPKPPKYKCLLMDPPWDLYQRSHGGSYGAAENHYSLMTLDEIRAMPIPDLLEDDAHVWMWATNAIYPYVFGLFEHWGFTYRSPMHWLKSRLGLGNYLRNASETCFFATRGKCPVNFKAQMNWGFFPVQEHSHKPEEVYDVIERISSGPYLELFARRPRYGWDQWGAECVSDVVIPGYPVPKYSSKAAPFVTAKDIAPPEMFQVKKKISRKSTQDRGRRNAS